MGRLIILILSVRFSPIEELREDGMRMGLDGTEGVVDD